ncbi:MAG: ABC transporter ATP-binding protein [Candidatus Micrarchaeota archaeon]|nr:ABC transporter ATP-binding protein [Candidatus Micrarchaeota archaeon]MCX8154390.1 ABC transporter ATP-binding protein [Candidatus Micrarchaeota archaeon]
MEEIVLELRGIGKYYLDGNNILWVFRDVNLKVKANEFVAIVAPSGSGKTTLLNIMATLDRPSEGKVFIDGIDISKIDDRELSYIRAKKIGFVFQQFNLIPELTALENVTLPFIFSGSRDIDYAIQLMKRIGLGERLNFYPSQLSGGQKQRVAIARALVNRPKILFADEPTGNLDPDSAKEVLRIFEELHKEGNTIILVTHDYDIARRAQRVYTIKNKTLVVKDDL